MAFWEPVPQTRRQQEILFGNVGLISLAVVHETLCIGIILTAKSKLHFSDRLLAILLFAVRWSRLETIAASVVAALGFLYYFQEPVGSLKATDPQSYVAV